MKYNDRPALFRRFALTFFLLMLAGCNDPSATQKAASAADKPPPQVGVVTIELGTIALSSELPGRLEASRMAEIRARVAGILQKRLFDEGADVKAGQTLFEIDDAPYQATLKSAQASVAQADANLIQAKAKAERLKPLLAQNAVSTQDYEDALAAHRVAEANLAVARAAVTSAKINLDYARITAPIDGRIGRALVTEGALVGQGIPTEMAVIQQIDPIYVNLTQPASENLRLQQEIAQGVLSTSGEAQTKVQLVFEDGSLYPHPGKLLFSDWTVDANTGQITLRAELPNPNKILLPGLYVRVRLQQAEARNAVLLPQQAVTRSQKGDMVMVVDANNVLSQRAIHLGPSQDGQWVVLDGLKKGEQVIVEGFQKLPRVPPGTPIIVSPQPWPEKQPDSDSAKQP